MNKTYLGTKYNFDFLRSWIKCPFTLEKHEDKALRAFINSHIDLDKSDFGWFFEVYYRRDLFLSQNEINGLLKIVDEMESFEKFKFEDRHEIWMENHLRYIAKQMDTKDRVEFFEIAINQRKGLHYAKLDIEYYLEEEE